MHGRLRNGSGLIPGSGRAQREEQKVARMKKKRFGELTNKCRFKKNYPKNCEGVAVKTMTADFLLLAAQAAYVGFRYQGSGFRQNLGGFLPDSGELLPVSGSCRIVKIGFRFPAEPGQIVAEMRNPGVGLRQNAGSRGRRVGFRPSALALSGPLRRPLWPSVALSLPPARPALRRPHGRPQPLPP